MLNNRAIFKDKSKRFLYTTALAVSLSMLANSAKSATALTGGQSYNTDDLEGFAKADGGDVNVTFTTTEGQFFNIGANATPSLANNALDSGTLNVAINNGGGSVLTSGIIFEGDIAVGVSNTINLNINDGNVTFRGNIGNGEVGSINIIAGSNDVPATESILNFQNANNESLNIFADIKKEVLATEGTEVNINVVNNSGNASNSISFQNNIGHEDDNEDGVGDGGAFINTLKIGDDGAAKTNNVTFNGQYLSASNIYIGVDGGAAVQTHNITLQSDLRKIRGIVYARDTDNATITNNSLDTVFYDSVANIDNFNLNGDGEGDGGSTYFKGNVSNSGFNINNNNTRLEFGSDENDSTTYVSAEIAVAIDVVENDNDTKTADIRFGGQGENSPVIFSGSISVADGSNVNVDIWNNAVIGDNDGGNITFANGNDAIYSNLGNNFIASAIDFGDGEDNFYVWDSVTTLTGAMTNLENIIMDNATLVVYQGGSYTGNIDGDDDGILAIGGYDDLSDITPTTYNAAGTVNTVALEVNGGATFNTNGHQFGSDTALSGLNVNNEATFNIQDNVTVDNAGTSIYSGTIRIGAGARLTTNDFYSDSGTLIFDIESPTSAGFLEVTENNLNLTLLTVEANLTGADSLFRDGNQIKVAQGDGALIGTNGEAGQAATAITENSALFSISMMDGGKLATPLSNSDLYLVFSQDATIQQIAEGSNNKNVGAVFDGLTGTENAELSQIIDKINAASQGELKSILESTTTDVGGGVAVGSQNFVNNTLDITSDQIDLAMNNSKAGVASGQDTSGLRTWGQYFFEDSKQGLRKGVAGFNSSTSGLAFGVDTTELLKGSVIGIGFSYGDTKVKSNNINNSRNKIDSYQLTAYGSYNLPSNYFIKAMVAYAQNKVDSTRYNVGTLGLNAQAKYNADLYTIRSDFGKDFKMGAMRFTPSLLAHYSHYKAENYSETGAGGASLNVNSKALEIFELGTNLELGWDYKLSNKRSLSPEIRVGYRHNLIGDQFRTSSSFSGGGSSFDTIGASPARAALTVGGGLIYQVTDQWDMSLNYEYEHRKDFNSKFGFARVAYHF